MEHSRDRRRDWDGLHASRLERRDLPPHRTHSPPPSHRDERSRYRDRDREGYHSPPRYSSRSRSRSPRNRHRDRSPRNRQPQNPSRDVMMEDLPVDMTEDDIRNELEPYVRGLEDVRIIKDRRTGRSRQFGFLRFSRVEQAATFLERSEGILALYGSNDRRYNIKVQFGKEREERQYEADWECPNCAIMNFSRRTECVRCHIPKSELEAYIQEKAHYSNTGDSDASMDSSPSQFLLVRSLESSVTEELLAKGIAKLYKTSDETVGAGAKKSTSKINSTTSITNYGAQDGSLKRVFMIRDRKTDESWRYGFAEFHSVEDAQAALNKYNASDKFTIASKPVLVSYVHAGVFVPVVSPTSPREKFHFTATSNPALRLAYWDEAGYANELLVSEETPHADPIVQEPPVSQGDEKPSREGIPKTKKRKADGGGAEASKKATLSHLQFWTNRQAELHGAESQNPAPQPARTGNEPSTTKDEVTRDGGVNSPPSQSYADMEKLCCLLCSRQFKNTGEVNRHERLSQLHVENLQNKSLKAKALAKLKRLGASSAQDAVEYRDRAKERRDANRQPKKPTASKLVGSQVQDADPEPEESKPAGKKSKGASMLGKMGWSAGEGLGAQGTGIAAPIATDAYVQGVGLGAQGGKLGDALDEASRNTKGGYDAFLERTKERAKERFEKMG